VLHRADQSSPVRRESIVPRGGVVGCQLPPLRAATLPIFRGDVLTFATDGVRYDFASYSPGKGPPQERATSLLKTFGKANDDALVLVLEYVGGPA
jgi:negative regulator of sigma-B (phosphoserine phosphatase)